MISRFQRIYFGEDTGPAHFRIEATGEVLTAVATNERTGHPGKLFRVGGKNNVSINALLDESTGEVRAFRSESAEEGFGVAPPPETQEPETTEETQGADSGQPLAIGDTVTAGGMEHTFHAARFYQGDEYMKPEPGTRWLLVDVEITNTTDEPVTVSTYSWTLVDFENRSVTGTYTGDERGALSGDWGPGRTMRGEIAYEVSADATNWEIILEPDMREYGQAIYEFSADSVQ